MFEKPLDISSPVYGTISSENGSDRNIIIIGNSEANCIWL